MTISASAGFKALVPHSIICLYFFVGDPEEKYDGNSEDLLLTIARICFLLILSTSDTETKPAYVLLDSKFGMQKNASPSLNQKQSCVNY